MTEFAVRVRGEDEAKGYWVLATDPVGERLLIAAEESAIGSGLRWVAIADCLLVKVASPEQPRPVVPIQTRQVLLDPHKMPA